MKAILLTFIFSLFIVHAQKSKNVAILKFVRGNVEIQDPDQGKIKAEKGKWIKEGSLILTGPKSVARLNFIDKSSMNIGPNSEMKVETFAKDKAGVIEVISGKIRSQVSKNYMELKKGKSKLFIKSKSAVMGIRGTDFIFSTNKKNGQSSAVLFEGSVVFNKNDGVKRSAESLEKLVDRGVRINPGQFSVSGVGMKRPTFPAKLDSRQFRALNKNKNLDNIVGSKKEKIRNIVPKGLSGEIISNDISDLKTEIKKKFNMEVVHEKKAMNMEMINGGEVGDSIKPPDGSPLHIDSASILPVTSASTFDKNTGEWRSQEFNVDGSGGIVPPEGYKITDEGKLLKVDGKGSLKEVVFEIRSPNEQQPIEEMPTQNMNFKGPKPAGGKTEGKEQEKLDGVLPSGQDWFVPNSQVNKPRFIGPNGSRIPSTKLKVIIKRNGQAP